MKPLCPLEVKTLVVAVSATFDVKRLPVKPVDAYVVDVTPAVPALPSRIKKIMFAT